jgi:hypothetical protein
LAAAADAVPDERFWTSGELRSARRIVGQLWGRPVTVGAL